MTSQAFASTASKQPVHFLPLIIVLALLNAFAPFATDMYLSSFPGIANTFKTDIAHVQWSLSAYFVGLAVGQLLYAPFVERFGRKSSLLVGVGVFTLCSVALIIVPNINGFISLRLLQALGGCAGMVVGRVIIQDLMSGHQAASALTLMMMIQGIAPIVAPVTGGYFYQYLGWQSVFVFLAAFGALCFFATTVVVPETLKQPRPIHFGNTLSIFKQLLQQRSYTVPLFSGSFAGSCMFVFISGSPFVFIKLFSLSAHQYGWLFGGCSLGMLLAGQVNRMMLRRHSIAKIYRTALWVQLIAAVALVAVTPIHNMWLMLLPLGVCIATIPVLQANATALAMDAGKKEAGGASSLLGVLMFAFAALASGLVGAFSNGTAYPMTMLMLAFSVLAHISLLFAPKAKKA